VAAALAPYSWREWTDRTLAQRVVGAVDRHDVVGFLYGIPGTDIGTLHAMDPAEAGDVRVDVLMRGLDGVSWRDRPLARLSADLVSALQSWHDARDSFAPDLRRQLDGH
jgi:hypothetical protein